MRETPRISLLIGTLMETIVFLCARINWNNLTYLCRLHTHLLWFIYEADATLTTIHSRLTCTHHFLLEVPLPPLCVTQAITGVVIEPSTFRPKVFLIVIICKRVVGLWVGHLWSKHNVFWQNNLNSRSKWLVSLVLSTLSHDLLLQTTISKVKIELETLLNTVFYFCQQARQWIKTIMLEQKWHKKNWLQFWKSITFKHLSSKTFKFLSCTCQDLLFFIQCHHKLNSKEFALLMRLFFTVFLTSDG